MLQMLPIKTHLVLPLCLLLLCCQQLIAQFPSPLDRLWDKNAYNSAYDLYIRQRIHGKNDMDFRIVLKRKSSRDSVLKLYFVPIDSIIDKTDGIDLDSVYIADFAGNIFGDAADTSLQHEITFKPRVKTKNDNGLSPNSFTGKVQEFALHLNVPITIKDSFSKEFVFMPSMIEMQDSITDIYVREFHFESSIELRNVNYQHFSMEKCYFRNEAFFSFSNNLNEINQLGLYDPYFSFLDCEFDSTVVISSAINSFNLFTNGVVMALYNQFTTYGLGQDTLSDVKISNCKFKGPLLLKDKTLSNLVVSRCEFLGGIYLQDRTLDSVFLERCTFHRVVDLRGTWFANSQGFAGNFFAPQCNVVVDKDINIDQLNMDITSLEKVFFVFDWGWGQQDQYVQWEGAFFTSMQDTEGYSNGLEKDPLETFTENNLEEVRRFYFRLDQYVQERFKNSDALESNRNKLKSWFNYQVSQYEKVYYRHHNIGRYAWLCFLEGVVNFGYEGERPFFICSGIIVLFFAVAYAWWFKNEIDTQLEPRAEKTKAVARDKKVLRANRKRDEIQRNPLSLDIEFLRALYFSFTVFLMPKFPSTYLSLSKPFIRLIIVEWAIGIFFIILFLTYIAFNYPIVTKLLGV